MSQIENFTKTAASMQTIYSKPNYREIFAKSNKNTHDSFNASYPEFSSEHLRTLITRVPVAVFSLNEDLEIASISPTALAWLKSHKIMQNKPFSPEKILGKKFEEIVNPCPAPLSSAIRNALKGEIWRNACLKHNIKNDDTDYWLRCEVFPLLSRTHQVTNVVIFLEDITHTEELVLCNKKLQQSNELLESFNLVFSHDLIQPLRQVANFIDIIQEHYADNELVEDSMGEIFSALRKSFDHVRNLSEGIVMYCKNGDLTVEPEQIHLRELINEIFESSLKICKCKFKLNFPDDLKLYANRTCMLQLFQNLFANAIKHSDEEDSTITLSVSKQDEFFNIFHLHNHGYCPGYIRKRDVFSPFQSSNTDGAGLGLMICKKIISAYNGKIRLHSAKPKGTLVSFTLPVFNEEDTRKNHKY